MKFYTTNDHVKICGRTIFRENIRYLGYSASSVSFTFTGKHAEAEIISNPQDVLPQQHAWIGIFINDAEEPAKRLELTENKQHVVLYDAETTATVTITILKYSEPEYAVCGIAAITIDSDELLPPPPAKQRRIQIIGDSITCGYGNEGAETDLLHHTATENPTKAYSYLTARALDADLEIVAWNGKGVITAYVGEEENAVADPSWLVPMLYQYTDAGCSRYYFGEAQQEWERWDENRFHPDLVIVYLGTNDASYTRDHADRQKQYREAYIRLLEDIHGKHPNAKILCTLGTMDQRLCPTLAQTIQEYQERYPEQAVIYVQLPMQEDADGLGTFWHPSTVTHRKMAEILTQKARELMQW